MAKRTSKYANMNAGDLARETRAKGLAKPNVLTLNEWADWLEAQDVKSADADTKATEAEATPAPATALSKPSTNPYAEWGKTELMDEALHRKLDVSKLRTKAELADALLAGDAPKFVTQGVDKAKG